jgi:hypothetical protein
MLQFAIYFALFEMSIIKYFFIIFHRFCLIISLTFANPSLVTIWGLSTAALALP